jgi:hypothetical protein
LAVLTMKWISRRAFTLGATSLGVLGARARAAADFANAFDPVTSDRDLRSVLWSWTTPEQAAALRNDKVLFTRAESPTLGRGHLFTVLAQRDGRLARLLDGPQLAKGRFAWVNPWSTCLGFGNESWGTELLRLELKPTAWMAIVATSHDDLRVVDLRGREVAEAAVFASPQRVAGVFFINDQYRFTTGNQPCSSSFADTAGGTWREIYLGNLAQVSSWSLGTPLIRQRLDDDRALLAGFSTYLAKKSPGASPACGWSYRLMRQRWTTTQANPIGRYEASLALADRRYFPSAAGVERLASELRQRLFEPAPLLVNP